MARGWEVRTPPRLEADACCDLDAAVVVVAAYRMLVPKPLLTRPPLGCLGIHPSLLPRWRGAAPIERALACGDPDTGVVIMRMEEGLDTGPVLARYRLPLKDGMNAQDVSHTLAHAGAQLICSVLETPEAFPPQPQDGEPTYAPRLDKKERRLLWDHPGAVVARQINALAPWCESPNGERLTVTRAVVGDEQGHTAPPGTVLSETLHVACAQGTVQLLELQRAGRRRLPASAFLRGYPLRVGARLS